jgi:4-hydroxy-tetrahydrodipicolinate reductase
MKIAILGYGKMGKAIEQIAISRGHKIVLKLDDFTKDIQFNKADVAIDFSVPEAAFYNISQALEHNIPIVSGTTGWLNQMEEVLRLCQTKKGSFIYSSNYSLGVNLFFSLNKQLAKLMQRFDYEPSIFETHHTQKLDAPSGTAISLANHLLPYSQKKGWTMEEHQPEKLKITSYRINEVAGTHQVIYTSPIDDIEIKHTAHNRVGFAQGAILAAEYIATRKGVFTMKDVLDL